MPARGSPENEVADRRDIAVAKFRVEVGKVLAVLHGAVHGHVAQARHHRLILLR